MKTDRLGVGGGAPLCECYQACRIVGFGILIFWSWLDSRGGRGILVCTGSITTFYLRRDYIRLCIAFEPWLQ